MKNTELFDMNQTIAQPLLARFEYPWEVLPHIAAFIREIGPTLSPAEYEQRAPEVWVARDAVVAESAHLGAPCIIDHGAEIRHCAFIRGSAIVGKKATVGNSTELKNALLFDAAAAPHYNYVGDSILGHRAHMGAGSITSNVKADQAPVVIHALGIATGQKKVGAFLGDFAEIGCNAVLCPGCIVGPHAIVYPLSMVRGIVPARHIRKTDGECIART